MLYRCTAPTVPSPCSYEPSLLLIPNRLALAHARKAGVPATVDYAASSGSCTSTPSTLWGNPAYPTGATPFERFGGLGRDVFHGPPFAEMDASLGKNFKLTERINLKFSAQFQNILKHLLTVSTLA